MKRIYQNWPVHNLIGHPVMQICNWLGLKKAARAIHDGTLPKEHAA
jgi:hypothetical protein